MVWGLDFFKGASLEGCECWVKDEKAKTIPMKANEPRKTVAEVLVMDQIVEVFFLIHARIIS